MKQKVLYQKLGETISTVRRIKRLTQEELAFVASIDRTYLARIEEGKANPSVKILNKIAKKLQVPIVHLLANV